jgi:hypothetical protein
MQPSENLNTLAERVEQGDAQARARLRDRLEKQMARITRRTLRSAPGSSELDSKIRATAHRLDPQGQAHPHLIQQVAANLCQTVVNRLWTGSTEGLLQTQAT